MAEQEYIEALEIYRRLAEKNPEVYDNNVARTLVNYAIMHSYTLMHSYTQHKRAIEK